MPLSVVILAAGQGRRMRSSLPKVMHKLAGKTLLARVLDTASRLPCHQIYVVYGEGGALAREAHPAPDAQWVEQKERLGTGHALAQVIDFIPDQDDVAVLYGDVPLLTQQTLEKLTAAAAETGFALLTAKLPDPTGYGRIIRDAEGKILKIVEEKDATEREKSVREINTGTMAVKSQWLKKWLRQLSADNAQKEYLLTDIVAMAVAEDIAAHSVEPDSEMEIAGVNDPAQLAFLERYHQFTQAQALMRQGVTLADPARFDLRGELQAGADVFIDINVIIEGKVRLGNGVTIGPNCVVRDAELGDGVVVFSHCVIDNAIVGRGGKLGPFARIRPGTSLGEETQIGNFVEVKQSTIKAGSKANHLAYIGDSEVGAGVNIGAGTITCNYDGADKHKTLIGDDVFIGSNTELVAPVTINDGATIAAGATITKDVEAGALALSKREQKTIKSWRRPGKKQE